MSKFTEYIGGQFGNPRGFAGRVCCLIMNVINRAMYINTVALLNINSSDRVLDIGYGNGFLLERIYRKTKAELHGVDISEDMKTEAEKRNAKALREGKLFLTVGDCCDLHYPDGYFSAAASVNTIYFWQDTVKGLSEIRRSLKSGGKFYNVVYTKQWLDTLAYTKKGFKKYEAEELIELGKKAGFEHAEVRDIVKGKSFVVIYSKQA